jgi:hypothetical protein
VVGMRDPFIVCESDVCGLVDAVSIVVDISSTTSARSLVGVVLESSSQSLNTIPPSSSTVHLLPGSLIYPSLVAVLRLVLLRNQYALSLRDPVPPPRLDPNLVAATLK